MSTDDIDLTFEDDATAAGSPIPDGENLLEVRELAQQQLEIESLISTTERRLKQLKKDHEKLTSVDLPAAMLEHGLTGLVMDSGETIMVIPFVYARIPKEDPKHTQALDWLTENGFSGLIKHIIQLSFSRGEDELAQNALQILRDAGFEPKDDETVPWNTLEAFVREQLEKGTDIPLEFFNGYTGQKTKVVPAK